MTPVDSSQFEEPFRSAFAASWAAAREQGFRVELVAGRRSAALQDRLHQERPTMALPADRSLHVRGLAADVSGPDLEKFALLARSYGLVRPRRDEPWHFELKRRET